MVGCESKNGHQKDVRWKVIGLHAQILLTIPNAINQHHSTFIFAKGGVYMII